MWETLQRYRALDADSQRIFRRAAVLLLWIRLSLKIRGYNKTYASLQARLAAWTAQPPDPVDRAGKTSRMVRAALRYSPVHFTCLEESLALWYLMRRQGLSPQLRIGVRKSDGKFEAHAWVELDGEALNQPEGMHRHYAAFEKEFAEPPAERS